MMRAAVTVAAVACFALALVCGVQAELRFDSERIVLNPPVGATEATAEFTFENAGEAPVRITEVKSSCGCTAAALEQDMIPPGKTGRIRANYHVGSRQGRNHVAIHVSTDEGRASPYSLSLEVNIKVAVQVLPRFVHWRVGAQAQEKTIRVTFEEGYAFAGVENATGDFTAKVVTSGEHAAELKVSPKDLWAKRNGTIRLKFTRGEGDVLEVPVLLRIL